MPNNSWKVSWKAVIMEQIGKHWNSTNQTITFIISYSVSYVFGLIKYWSSTKCEKIKIKNATQYHLETQVTIRKPDNLTDYPTAQMFISQWKTKANPHTEKSASKECFQYCLAWRERLMKYKNCCNFLPINSPIKRVITKMEACYTWRPFWLTGNARLKFPSYNCSQCVHWSESSNTTRCRGWAVYAVGIQLLLSTKMCHKIPPWLHHVQITRRRSEKMREKGRNWKAIFVGG